MSVIVRKMSSRTWSGFEDFKTYYLECLSGVPPFTPLKVVGSEIVFDADAEAMDGAMNHTAFRFFWNLLPAGTDVVTASCQLYILMYRDTVGLANESGTYTLRVKTWQRAYEYHHQVLSNPEQDNRATFTNDPGSWKMAYVTICL
ncbi:hypothetical protein ACTD5D_10145 [Nocardia takedensis]|uniref:hypothetical protein n=1 Tax=Nocardia takedensis TaxID=259390 RepID=UPI003F773D9E